MSETELLDLQISIARVTLLKKIEQYRIVAQNGSEIQRIKCLCECVLEDSRLYTLQNQKTKGGITSWEENA